MYRILILATIISLISCNSNKAILAYVKQENVQNKRILIIDKKVNLKVVLFTLKNGLVGKGNIMKKGSSVFSISESENIIKKYKNDTLTEFWEKSKFKNMNVEFIPSNLEFIKNKKKEDLSNTFYAFSKILNYKNKSFFFISKKEGFQNIGFSGVVIMQKINGSWIEIEKINDTELN